MENYSQTQASNISILVGVIMLVLNHFRINIGSDEVTLVIGGLFAVGGVIVGWIHRYQKGDITIAGFRK